MSAGPAVGGGAQRLSRRELLAAAARWSVPTVATITLGARVLEAKASCPPCTKKSGGKCKSCSISQILNCNCEPCLGPPYCTGGGPAPPVLSPSMAPGSRGLGEGLRAPGGSGPFLPGSRTARDPLVEQLLRSRYGRSGDPFRDPLYRDPFGVRRAPGRDSVAGSLYERLRSGAEGRRP